MIWINFMKIPQHKRYVIRSFWPNWSWFLKRFLENANNFSLIPNDLPFKESVAHHINKTWISLNPKCFLSGLSKKGPVILENTMKIRHFYNDFADYIHTFSNFKFSQGFYFEHIKVAKFLAWLCRYFINCAWMHIPVSLTGLELQ